MHRYLMHMAPSIQTAHALYIRGSLGSRLAVRYRAHFYHLENPNFGEHPGHTNWHMVTLRPLLQEELSVDGIRVGQKEL